MNQTQSAVYSADTLRAAAEEVARALVVTLQEKIKGGYRPRLGVTPQWEGLDPTTSQILAAKPEAFREAVEAAVYKHMTARRPARWIACKMFGNLWTLRWSAAGGEPPISGVVIELRR